MSGMFKGIRRAVWLEQREEEGAQHKRGNAVPGDEGLRGVSKVSFTLRDMVSLEGFLKLYFSITVYI